MRLRTDHGLDVLALLAALWLTAGSLHGAGAGVSLQKSGSLEPAPWGIVPGTTGANHYQEPTTNTAVFYRLIREL